MWNNFKFTQMMTPEIVTCALDSLLSNTDLDKNFPQICKCFRICCSTLTFCFIFNSDMYLNFNRMDFYYQYLFSYCSVSPFQCLSFPFGLCGGLDENGSYRLIRSGTIGKCGLAGGSVSLEREEVCHWSGL